MKLIDLLVQELPKRGGWPDGAEIAVQDADSQICFSSHGDVYVSKDQTGWYGGDWGDGDWSNPFIDTIADDRHACIVTRCQYESALAASQKPAWNGEGVPPVGCECESKQFSQVDWNKFKVVAVCDGHVFGFWGNGVSAALDSKMWEFRPLQSEAGGKRDAAIEAMQRG